MTDPLTAALLNSLTGSFDAVVQVSRPTVDRLSATMHQNHGNDAGLPTLPHRLVARIGDVPPQPPGSPGVPIFTVNIRGTAHAQIGVPTVSFVAQAPRALDLSCWIRIRYRADPGTVPLPEFMHGRVEARVAIEPESVGGVSGLRATVSPDDAHVKLVDSGLTGDDLKNVTMVVRSFLRSRFDAFLELSADLPAAVGDLRTHHDTQGRGALALPLTLQGAPPHPGNLASVFLEGSDFAIAVSGWYIVSLVQSHLDALKETHPKFWINVKYWGTAHYTVTFTAAEATWLADGRIHVYIAGHAKTGSWWAPNVSFTVKQDLELVVNLLGSGPDVSIVPLGEPDASASASFDFAGLAKTWAKDAAKARFAEARDAALVQAQPLIAQSLAKTQLLRDLLVRIDDAATLEWNEAVASAAGITLRGRIVVSPRKAPRVEFAEIGDGSGYSAFESWVPGGRIESYYWTWWRSGDLAPLTNEPESHMATFTDRWVLQEENLPTLPASSSPSAGGQPTAGVVTPLPAGSFPVTGNGAPVLAFDGQSAGPVWGQACVSITGKHVDPKTGEMKGSWAQTVIEPGLACSFAAFSPVPREWEEFPIPPPIGGDPPPFQLRVNVLVYAPGELDTLPEGAAIVEAVRQVERPDAGLVLLVGSRLGSRGPGRALADRAQELQRELPQVAVVLADRDRPLLRGGAASPADGRPGLRLVDPAGRVVWNHEGAFEPSTLSAALRAHLVPTPPPRPRLLRTALRSGDPAPDFAFELDGHRVMMRRLRGRRVAVAFAAADEPPDVLLRRLSARPGEAGEPRPLVVLVRDGDGGRAAPSRRPEGFDLGTVVDNGAIARRYGIQARPTVVLVDWDGRVSTVQTIGPTARTSAPSPG